VVLTKYYKEFLKATRFSRWSNFNGIGLSSCNFKF
jgi:hypothetical protein